MRVVAPKHKQHMTLSRLKSGSESNKKHGFSPCGFNTGPASRSRDGSAAGAKVDLALGVNP
jgi:hypothetical protein